MKNLSLFSLLLMVGMVLFLGGCQREEESQLQKGDDITNSIILDSLTLHKFLLPHKDNYTSGGRSGDNMVAYDSLNKICDLILKQDSTHHFLSNFINNFGFPNWAKSFSINEERGLNQIITIPFVKDSIVTGVLQYHSALAPDGLIFFSRQSVHRLLNFDLTNNKLEINGVISYIIAQNRSTGKVDDILKEWMVETSNGFTNRDKNGSRYEVCITYCGWIGYMSDISNSNGLVLYHWDCINICYQYEPPRPHTFFNRDFNFLSYITSSWWNFFDNISNGTGGTINVYNNNNDTRPWKEIKLQNAKECISKAFGIKNIQTMNKIKSASELLCGTTYEDQLIQAYDNMIEQGKDCDDLEAVNEMINDMATEVEKNIEWTKTDDFAKISEFLDENPHIDPCTGKNMKNNILKSMCDSDMSMAALNAALEGVDYVTKKELEDSKELFELLGITNESDKLKFLSGSDCGSDGEGKCKNCSVGESGIVFLDHERAKDMLKCAIAKLKTFDGASPENIFYSMQNHLVNNPNQNFTNYLIKTFQWILFNTSTTEYQMQDPNSGNCEGAIAWTYPLLINDIYLCGNTYLNENPIDRSETLIHEMMHVYFLRADLAYSHQTQKYFNLTDTQRLFNADSYSNFIKDICGQ